MTFMRLTAFYLLASLVACLSGCGGGSAPQANTAAAANRPVSATGTGTPLATTEKQATAADTPATRVTGTPLGASQEAPATPIPASGPITLSGHVTYDRIPFGANGGLDYPSALAAPVRGAKVVLLDDQNTLLAEGITTAEGLYSLAAPREKTVKVRVYAQLVSQAPSWQVSVADNTQNNAPYVLEGRLANTGSAPQQQRHLHAGSGWADGWYSQPRSAAPFAILDTLYNSLQRLASGNSQLQLPPLQVRWSEKNVAAAGDVNQGFIGSSFYSHLDTSIYLLGKADNDSDEYDRAVIQHEFGHFLEDKLGRSDTLGGRHTIDSQLDMRLAFSEGWANAFAGISDNQPLYEDSMGAHQSQAYRFNLADTPQANPGWFSERSIHSLIWHLWDSTGRSKDSLSQNFKALYDVFTSPRFRQFEGVISIYPFIALLQEQHPDAAPRLSQLMREQHIFGTGLFGEGEQNAAGKPQLLPVYQLLTLGSSSQVCSSNTGQEGNGALVRRLVRLQIPADGLYSLSAEGPSGSNPDFRLWRQGEFVLQSTQTGPTASVQQQPLRAGTYTLEVYDAQNTDGNTRTGGDTCIRLQLN